MITVPGFPNSFQTEYARIPKAPLPGDLWEGEIFNERPIGGLIANVTPVAYASTVTIANFVAGDEVGITVKGVDVVVTAVTDASATAALLNAKINAAALLSGVLSSTVAGPALTLAGALGVDLNSTNVVEFSPDTTTSAITGITDAVVQQQLDFGYGVVRDIPSLTVNRNAIKKPTAASDKFVGVLVRTRGGQIPAAQIEASGFDPDWLMPGMTYAVLRENAGVVVEFVGTEPTESDDVYLLFSGTNAGKWQTTDGSTPGTNEVVTLTLTTTAADLVAFNYDGLPDLSIASASGTETTDAATLFGLWKANASYMAIGDIVDNLDGTLTITFFDTTTHAFTDNSGGTSSIAENVDTPAVASTPATAMLIADYSWGLPSIPASADLPARAFLRLSPS